MKKSLTPRSMWGLAISSTRLALDAQHVIALRMAKLALGGPAAKREAAKMIAERPRRSPTASISCCRRPYAGRATGRRSG